MLGDYMEILQEFMRCCGHGYKKARKNRTLKMEDYNRKWEGERLLGSGKGEGVTALVTQMADGGDTWWGHIKGFTSW